MKKNLKWIKNIVWFTLVGILVLYIACTILFPTQTAKIIGYRFYTVLTDSMEPVIPTYSLVLSKMLDEDEVVQPGEIVSFHVNYFGEDRVYTHYLKKIETQEDGSVRYYTQGAAAPDYDSYETHREDLIGTYVFHVPYVGKFVLFAHSKFALAELGIIVVISVIFKILWSVFDAEEKLDQTALGTKEQLRLKGVDESGKKGKKNYFGVIYNSSKQKSVEAFTMTMRFFGENRNLLEEKSIEVKELAPREKKEWEFETSYGKQVKDFLIVLHRIEEGTEKEEKREEKNRQPRKRNVKKLERRIPDSDNAESKEEKRE